MQTMVYTNMGVTYREQKQLDTAEYYSKKALHMANTDSEKVYAYMNMAFVFFDKNMLDSARYYLDISETLYRNVTDKNPFTRVSLNKLRYRVEKKDGNLELALHYQELYTEYQYEITGKNDRQLLLEMQRKYNLAAKETEHNREMNARLKWMGGLALALLLLAGVCLMMIQKNKKQKAELAIARQQFFTMQELYRQKDNDMNDMKKMFIKKMEIAKSIAILTPYLDEHLKGKSKKTDQELIWEVTKIAQTLKANNFVDIANELSPGFTDRLKNICPELNEREISICCLVLFNFSNEEIDLLINDRYKGSTQTVQNWKTAIRRKLNIKHNGNLQDFLMNI